MIKDNLNNFYLKIVGYYKIWLGAEMTNVIKILLDVKIALRYRK